MQRWFQDFHKSFAGVFPLELIQYLQAATSQERKTVQAKLVRFQKSSSGSLVCAALFVGRWFSPIAVDTKLLAGTCVWTERQKLKSEMLMAKDQSGVDLIAVLLLNA